MKTLFCSVKCMFAMLVWLILLLDWGPAAQAQVTWKEHPGSPVLSLAQPDIQDWERAAILMPTVIQHRDTLKMWYVGTDDVSTIDDDLVSLKIGYAWSIDGLNWTRHDGPVFLPRAGQWDNPSVLYPRVLADGDTLRMWYAGGRFFSRLRMGYATSTDGIHWDRHPAPVIRQAVGSWYADNVYPGDVIKEDGLFKMWFTGGVGPLNTDPPSFRTAYSVGYATSPDGITWTLHDEPVLRHSGYGSGAFDAIVAADASVVRTTSGYEMWYSGNEDFGGRDGIGYATSPDGITWTKHSANPVLMPPGLADHWAGTAMVVYFQPSVLFDAAQHQYRMWFAGINDNGDAIGIGYATAPIVGTSVEESQSDLPSAFTLHQNYPNPFTPETTIRYDVHRPGHVILGIYDVLGQRIRTLVDAPLPTGAHAAVWDGRNDAGEVLASGVYLARMQVGSAVQSQAMLLVR